MFVIFGGGGGSAHSFSVLTAKTLARKHSSEPL